MGINSKGCIRQEVDDIGLSPREIPDTNFRPSLLDCLTDLMRKLGKLRFGLTAFLEIEIGPFI